MKVAIYKNFLQLLPHQLDVLPTYVVEIPDGDEYERLKSFDGFLVAWVPKANRRSNGELVFPHGNDWSEVVAAFSPIVEVLILVDTFDSGRCNPARLRLARRLAQQNEPKSLVGTTVILNVGVLQRRTHAHIKAGVAGANGAVGGFFSWELFFGRYYYLGQIVVVCRPSLSG